MKQQQQNGMGGNMETIYINSDIALGSFEHWNQYENSQKSFDTNGMQNMKMVGNLLKLYGNNMEMEETI